MLFVNFTVCQLRYFVQNLCLLGMRLQHATLGEEKTGPLANLHQAGNITSSLLEPIIKLLLSNFSFLNECLSLFASSVF
jgi:hypothetical protein